MKKPILISVMVPAFNEEKGIGQCLAALKEQNFPKNSYEVVVVDNNSTDKTAQIAQKAGVKVVFEKKQGGVFTLRKGCSLAKGDVIAFTDADSLVPRDWLQKIYQAFQKDPDIVCVGGRTIHQPRFFLAVLVELIYNYGGWLFRFSPGNNLSIRKGIYQKIGGFRKEINFDADFDLCLRAKKEGKMAFLWDNPVTVSSRHFQGREGLVYCLKGAINIIALIFFGKTVFFEFGAVRA